MQALVLSSTLTTALALVLDKLLGEPARWHPVKLFGQLAGFTESICNRQDESAQNVVMGTVAWGALCLPTPLFLYWLLESLKDQSLLAVMIINIAVLYVCVALRSLNEHGMAVQHALQTQSSDHEATLQLARKEVAKIVSRDCSGLDESEIASATVESVLENGSDAVIAPIIWFVLLGAPGVLLHRLANTLDAMWGYKNSRFKSFGLVAARADDVLNLIPARCSALLYTLFGNSKSAFRSWRSQAHQWTSPNAGPVMAAGAGALELTLGGSASYHRQIAQRPLLGVGPSAVANDISRSLQLVSRAVLWLLCLIFLYEVIACILIMVGS